MKPFHFLNFPDSYKKELRKNHIASHIDFHRFSIKHQKYIDYIFEKFIWVTIDTDNSNTFYSDSIVSFRRFKSKNWDAYECNISLEWIWNIQGFYLEIYSASSAKLLKSLWRIDFPGWFFHFQHLLREDIVQMYYDMCEWDKKYIISSRVDIAIDTSVVVPPMFLYIKKSSSATKKDIKCYNWVFNPDTWNYSETSFEWYKSWNFQSYSYLPKKSKWIGLRVYNKHLDILAKRKQNWYAGSDLPENMTRFEFVYTSDYLANNSIKNIIEISQNALFDKVLGLWMNYKSKSDFSLSNLYDYVDKYCKTRAKNTDEVIWDLYEKKVFKDWKNISDSDRERIVRMYSLIITDLSDTVDIVF